MSTAHARHRAPSPREQQRDFDNALAERDARISELEEASARLNAENDSLTCKYVKACSERERFKTLASVEATRVARRNADLTRLRAALTTARQALADARPRITIEPARVRPYAAAVSIPYPVPVGSGEPFARPRT